MSDDENIPDAATAQRLIKEFEGVTNTNEALAQQLLQVSFSLFIQMKKVKNFFYQT